MLEIRLVDPVETRPLRQRILRPHQTLVELAHPGEALPEACAFGAFSGNRMVATALAFPQARTEAAGRRPWRLISMAVDTAHQREGAGTGLVQFSLAHVAEAGGDELWCHARIPAVGFYEAVGFRAVGSEWTEPHTGPHILMWRWV